MIQRRNIDTWVRNITMCEKKLLLVRVNLVPRDITYTGTPIQRRDWDPKHGTAM